MDLGTYVSAIREPMIVLHHLNWRVHRQLLGKSGKLIMNSDWDNLLILDACRYDLFKSCNDISGDLDEALSAGSHTVEFLHANFDDRVFPDTVYVTATPQLQHEGLTSNFHHVEHLWKSEWDDELRTVPPEKVAERTVDVLAQYPNKRIISHFVQPHYPFIGETGRELEQEYKSESGLEDNRGEGISIWDRLETGQIDSHIVQKAYRENLQLILPVISDLVNQIDGKTVITSDHGNSFGRFGLYGHPPKKYIRDLVKVPWLEVPFEKRRKIVEGDLTNHQESEEMIQDRLADLGYVD